MTKKFAFYGLEAHTHQIAPSPHPPPHTPRSAGGEAASDQEGAVRLRPAPPERRPLTGCAQLDAVDGSPSAARRRLLNLKYPLTAGSAAATCNFFAFAN